MAQHLPDPDDCIDDDAILVKPSPNRVRNILTLEERVAAIQAYYCRPMYSKVARMFNCSRDQIRNIIEHREEIMEFYEATKRGQKEQQQQQPLYFNQYQQYSKQHQQNEYRCMNGNGEEGAYQGMDLKQRKLRFLGECIYEYIQRIQYHACQDITEQLLRKKALEFSDIIDIPDFYPNKQWLNQFKALYDISLANRQITLTRVPPSSLDLKDIMTYCSKNQTNKMKTSYPSIEEIKELQQNRQQQHLQKVTHKTAIINLLDDPNIEDVEERRRIRKLNFLEKALAEYILRAKFHHKCIQLNSETLLRVARELNDILKIRQFVPTHTWIQEFQKRQDEMQKKKMQQQQQPPLSLELKDILSYCSRMDNKERAPTITLAPKHPTIHYMYRLKTPPPMNLKFPNSAVKFKNDSIIYLDEDEDEDKINEFEKQGQDMDAKDIKPDIEETKLLPITTSISFSVNSPSYTYISTNKTTSTASPLLRPPLRTSPPIKIRRIESINAELVTKIKQENHTENFKNNNNIITNNNINHHTNNWNPELCKEKTSVTPLGQEGQQKNLITVKTNNKDCSNHRHYPQDKNDSNGIRKDEEEVLPRQVRNHKDALRLLKPLEEFVLLKEHYRAIGLIAQLEDIFKNMPNNKRSNDDET